MGRGGDLLNASGGPPWVGEPPPAEVDAGYIEDATLDSLRRGAAADLEYHSADERYQYPWENPEAWALLESRDPLRASILRDLLAPAVGPIPSTPTPPEHDRDLLLRVRRTGWSARPAEREAAQGTGQRKTSGEVSSLAAASQVETWTLRSTASGGAMLHGGREGSVKTGQSAAGSVRALFDWVQQTAPETLEVRRGQVTCIEAAGEVAAWLPLYLDVTGDPDADHGWPEDPLLDLLASESYDLHGEEVTGEFTNLIIRVNGVLWITSESPQGWIALPRPSLGRVWAEWSFCETGSMTSGIDQGRIGALTEHMGYASEFMDEAGSRTVLFPIDETTERIVAWLEDGWILGQMMDTWLTGPEEMPLIAGFQRLLDQPGVEQIVVWGSDFGGGEGIGLTDSSEWTFSCSADVQIRGQLRHALER